MYTIHARKYKRQRIPEGANNNGQTRETGNIDENKQNTKSFNKRQRIPEGANKNGQFRETGNIVYTRRRKTSDI
jgi:hypothetical protein